MDNNEKDEFFELKINFASQVLHKIDELEQSILQLENEKNEEVIKKILRNLISEFHSIKGSSGALQFDAVKIICHKVEDVVLSEGVLGLGNRVEELLKYCDVIRDYFSIFNADHSIYDNVFVVKHKDIFENTSLKKKSLQEESQDLKILNVLVLGIQSTLIKNLKKCLPSYDLRVSFASNSVNAIERISKEKFDIMLSSYFVEPINGLSLCAAIKCQWPKSDLKFILLPSQDLDRDALTEMVHLVPDKIIYKSIDMYNQFSTYIMSMSHQRMPLTKIICFDDEESILALYQLVLGELKNVQVKYISSQVEFIREMKNFRPELTISDVNMPNVNINGLLAQYKVQSKFIFVTGDTTSTLCKQLSNEGALGVIDKADILEGLIAHIKKYGFEFS